MITTRPEGGMHRTRELRIDAGYTLTAAAKRAGMSPAMLCRIERGQVSPTLRTLERIAQALGVETADLLTRRPTVAA